jgi:hypothetical protein
MMFFDTLTLLGFLFAVAALAAMFWAIVNCRRTGSC